MQLPPEMRHTLLWNWFGMALLTAALVLIRFDQEEADRKVQGDWSSDVCSSDLVSSGGSGGYGMRASPLRSSA